QYSLIEQSWPFVCLLTSAEMKKFVDQNETVDDESQYVLFQSIVKDLVLRSIDQTEYTLLKSIITFNIRK
ncbi:unnamed protein product, partial [Rotaria sp. Silwood1]